VSDLEEVYRAYLACLDARELDRLDAYVHDTLVYNDRSLTREDYCALLADDVARIPDLVFTVDLLVVRGDHVACRLWFDCTPRATFHGIEPDGRRVSFAEHVFYRFHSGRIAQVWSLIDLDAVRAQLDAS
jgi:predicted ester cyclase